MDGNYSLRRAHKRLPWVAVVGGGGGGRVGASDSGQTHLGASLAASRRALPERNGTISFRRASAGAGTGCLITVTHYRHHFFFLLSTPLVPVSDPPARRPDRPGSLPFPHPCHRGHSDMTTARSLLPGFFSFFFFFNGLFVESLS